MERNCLLIGNGLNRIKNNEKEWGNILKKVAEYINNEYSSSLTTFAEIDLSNVEKQDYSFQFEYMVNCINSNFLDDDYQGKQTYKEVKEIFVEKVKEDLKPLDDKLCEMINSINIKYIMTTNYDVNLESSLCGLKNYTIPFDVSKKNRSIKYLFNRTNKTNFAIKGKDIYHIHGIETNPSSICLGFEHYAGMVSQLRERLSGLDYISIEEKKRNKPYILEYLESKRDNIDYQYQYSSEFEVKFFENNISIVGLALSSSEIDIWWLLVFRAYLYFSNICNARETIKNVIKYYDIVSKEKIDDIDNFIINKREMFGKMHVEYVPTIIDNWSLSKKEKTELYLEIFSKIKQDYSK